MVIHDLAVPPLTVQPVDVPASQGVVLSFPTAFKINGAAHCGGDGVVAGLVVEASVPVSLSVALTTHVSKGSYYNATLPTTSII